ncbi:MAG: hypothetical protein A2V65_08755 [Deltaproteobacteria bacterium RBG_13_49_15]|nr:MAG: hypothetical protein A2V65_08755 [Deltaproteobacteria bacterium RBG_13_49_15]
MSLRQLKPLKSGFFYPISGTGVAAIINPHALSRRYGYTVYNPFVKGKDRRISVRKDMKICEEWLNQV